MDLPQTTPDASGTPALEELRAAIEELQERVASMSGAELDAAELESRLRQLGELANRASAALEAAVR